MRILFTGVPSLGHLFPMLPLARAFRQRGDSVAFLITESFVPAFAAEDLEILASGPEPGDVLAEVTRRTGVDLLTAPTPDGEIEAFAGVRVDMAAEQSLAVAGKWEPDLIVNDPYDFVGPLVAAAVAVPSAVVNFGPGISAEFVRPATAAVASRYTDRGLTWRPADWVLDTCPPALQWDGWQRPSGWLPLRPEAHRNPDGVASRAPAELLRSPRILVTFGTVFTDPAVLSPVLDALTSAGAAVRVTLGNAESARDFDIDPSTVEFEEFLPLNELLKGIDVVVAHGGAGTTMGTLAQGIPLVLAPRGADQSVHASRAAVAGTAIALSRDAFGPDATVAAVRTALSHSSFRDNARRVADEIRALPSPYDVAATLAAAL